MLNQDLFESLLEAAKQVRCARGFLDSDELKKVEDMLRREIDQMIADEIAGE